MVLKQLTLLNFKNYTEADLKFCGKINCFTGFNGTGKTNLLDAIHYLSFCKSYFSAIDSNAIKHNCDFFMIQGLYEKENAEIEVGISLKRNQKKIVKRNKKEYERLSEHIGQFPLVIISPYDNELINGASELRRKFIDSAISQHDALFLDNLISYNHALKQRNGLLKAFSNNSSFDKDTLEIYDEQLHIYGHKILQARTLFLEEFLFYFDKNYKILCDNLEELSLMYDGSVKEGNIKEALHLHLKKDLILQYTGVGPHKDDLDFLINGLSLKKFASQGQQKTFLLALKLAQFEYLCKKTNTKPLLLLDDIYDKLDEQRFKQLIDLVSSKNFGQVFITDTHQLRMQQLFNTINVEYKLFHAREDSLLVEVSTSVAIN
ncbi:MAG: DNA replication/repair protein RecF [Bacteroidetes bacterium]|nr:DNA replication/repair protein RecF [Bacteroidota bacterium]